MFFTLIDQLQALGAEGDFPVLVTPPGPIPDDEKPPAPIDLAGKAIFRKLGVMNATFFIGYFQG